MLELTEDGKQSLPLLPTGKPHTSYSEYSDWDACGLRHKLKHIDKIYLDSGSIHTIYGQIMHDALEERINHKKGLVEELTPPEVWAQRFMDDFNSYFEQAVFRDEEDKKKVKTLASKFVATFDNPINSVIDWLDTQFPEWEPVHAEIQIYEPLSLNPKEGYFKGFIDLVIKAPKYNNKGKNRKKIPNEFVYFVLDWKTTEWGWTTWVKNNLRKQTQLLLYKNYYAKIANIPLDEISVGWILVKRKPKKGELPFELIIVPSPEEKVKNAVLMARQMVTLMNKQLYFKNYNECLYCTFRTTEHCTLVIKSS